MWKQVEILKDQSKIGLCFQNVTAFWINGMIAFCRYHAFPVVCDLAAVNRFQKCRTAKQCRFTGTGRAKD